MKILIVTQYFWPENFKINDFALALKSLNHEVTILTGRPNYPEGKFFNGYTFFNKRKEDYEGIKVIRSWMFSRGKSTGIRLFMNYISFAFFASVSAIIWLKKTNDIIFVYEPSPVTVGIPAVVYKFFSKAPMFFWVQDLWPESVTAAGNVNSKALLKIIERIVKYIYRKSDVIFITSKSFRRSITEKGIDDKKIRYLPNWAEEIFTGHVEKNEEICKLLPVKGFKIIFAGNVGDAQDFESIIKAADLTKDHFDIHWIIIGDGRKKSWVEQQIKYHDLKNIHLLGKYPVSLMPCFFKEADVLLVTLKNEHIFSLTVPAKIQSYLACGKPVLAMINGDGAEIINESKAGFSMNAGNYKKLALKAVEMSTMPKEHLESMGLAGKEYYMKNFNRKKLIDNVLDIFKLYVSE